MIVFQDTAAHPLPAGDILSQLDIVGIVRDLTDEYDPGFLIQRIVRYPVALNLIAVLHKLLYHVFIQPASRLMPELDRRIEVGSV